MDLRGIATVAACVMGWGCVVQEPGTGKEAALGMPVVDGAAAARDAATSGRATPLFFDAGAAAPSLTGASLLVGCADGTREGFLDVTAGGWPDIAACAGGFMLGALVLPAAATPRCDRKSGNTSRNPAGQGCTAADLCSTGWHLCRGPADVFTHSVSACESAVPPGYLAFYAVAGGSEPAGHCTANPKAVNDLHGCGTYGQPEFGSCFPLDRRLGVADCRTSGGVWQCGDAVDHLREAELALKPSPLLGGVLCCRDP